MKKKSENILLPSPLLFLVAFVEGFLIMGVELTGAKIAAPFYGTSFFVWTTIIGITLSCLSIGYYVGGRLTIKYSSPVSLVVLLLLSGLFIFIMPFTGKWLLTQVIDLPILTGVVLGVTGYLLLPLSLLGMLSPGLINLLAKNGISAGKSSGKIYAISTFAGIVSAILYGFWLLPSWGIILNIFLFSTAVLILAAFLSFKLKAKYFATVAVLATIVFFMLFMSNRKKSLQHPDLNVKTVYQSEGLLGQIKVMDNIDGQSRTLYVNNSSQTRSHITGRSLFPYVYRISTFVSHKPPGSSVLLAGLGGGNLVYELDMFKFNIEVVELDQRIKEVAKKYFAMPSNVPIVINDARYFIKTTTKKYDVIILDLSAGETMPSNVYTKEAFIEMRKLLKPEGIIVLHFISNTSEEGLISVLSIGKTFEEAGYNVDLLNTSPSPENTSPFIFIASLHNIDYESLNFTIDPDLPSQLIPDKQNLLMNLAFDKGFLLTDDKPFLDVIHRPIVMDLRRDNIEQIVKPLSKGGVKMFK